MSVLDNGHLDGDASPVPTYCATEVVKQDPDLPPESPPAPTRPHALEAPPSLVSGPVGGFTDGPPPEAEPPCGLLLQAPPIQTDLMKFLDEVGANICSVSQQSDGDDTGDGSSVKPPARRASTRTNLTAHDMPMGYEDVARAYNETATVDPSTSSIMSNAQIDQLLLTLDGGEQHYNWTGHHKSATYGYGSTQDGCAPHTLYGEQADLFDKVAEVQDTLCDLETNFTSVDGQITDIATGVDSLGEDIHVFKEEVELGMTSVREDIHLLTAQVNSLNEDIIAIKELLLGRLAQPFGR